MWDTDPPAPMKNIFTLLHRFVKKFSYYFQEDSRDSQLIKILSLSSLILVSFDFDYNIIPYSLDNMRIVLFIDFIIGELALNILFIYL